jgi:hypothetical protein
MTRSQSRPLTHHAREILATVSHAYPTAWQPVDSVRAACGKGVPQWPDWCFLPYRHAHAIATDGSGQLLPYERSHHPSMLGALVAWRVTQGIYRFDPALYNRIAHWHTFLVGTGRAERRVKWLPVIPVNMNSPDLLAATTRRVE